MHKYLWPLLAIAALAGVGPAWGQMDLGMGLNLNQVGGKGSAPFSLPGTPYAAYSTRKVVSSYAGSAMLVYRFNDAATQNIGFAGTSFDIAGYNTFCPTQCGIKTWYDQSGNGRDMTQSNTAGLPRVIIVNNRERVSWPGVYTSAALPFTASGDLTLSIGGFVEGIDSQNIPIANYDGSTGWLYLSQGLSPTVGAISFWADGGGEHLYAAGLHFVQQYNTAFTRASGAVTAYVNGAANSVGSGSTGVTPSGNTPCIGTICGSGYAFDGLFQEVYMYTSALTTPQLLTISASEAAYWPANLGLEVPYQGAHWVMLNGVDNINLGNVLQYEYTQPWTVFGAIQIWGVTLGPQIIFSNVTTNSGGPVPNSFPGYELWVDAEHNCRLIVRVISNVTVNEYMGVYGTTSVCDLKKHFVAASYDGSGLAAGIKLYVDGVQETTAVETDSLGGHSIVFAGQSFYIGVQQTNGFPLHGMLGHFQLDNVVRSAGYIATYATPSSLPPIDGNTALSLALTGGSGTTAIDSSGNGLNGTLTSANMWVP
jgi:Alpha-L-arabinofuranosidase B, catalytic/Concanavalin A-like lectin/glucanases superfamily